MIDLVLLLCMPYAGRFTDYHLHYPKINTFYLSDDSYVRDATKIEKLDLDIISRFKGGDETLVFTGVTIEAT